MARAAQQSAKRVTIRAVAELAGVSSMTVSNVLNGKKVQEGTRQAVLTAVRELNYIPNPAARALASGVLSRIGLIYSDPQSAYLSAVLVGILRATERFGAQLLIRRAPSQDQDGTATAIEALVQGGADALILAAPRCEIVSATGLRARFALPMMAIGAGDELPDLPGVRIDDRQAARAMTKLLIGRGHSRIGFIAGPLRHLSSAARLSGYKDALEAAAIQFDGQLVRIGNYDFESGLPATEALLDLERPPSAIFASSDDMAAAVVSTARRRGLNIPEDLAVAGFDDTPIAVKIWPPLTTVRQPIVEIAERAIELLIGGIGKPAPEEAPITTYVPFDIVERESTGLAAEQGTHLERCDHSTM